MEPAQEDLEIQERLSSSYKSVNDYLWNNCIASKPTIFSMDVKNLLHSVTKEVALHAINDILEKRNIKRKLHSLAEQLLQPNIRLCFG